MIVSRLEDSTVEVNWPALATALKDKVIANLEKSLKEWVNDFEMQSMALGDAATGLSVCEVILRSEWDVAEEILYKADTAPREHIYDWIDEITEVYFLELMMNR
jgi:hypothetical protein